MTLYEKELREKALGYARRGLNLLHVDPAEMIHVVDRLAALEQENARLEALLQQTHGCHSSWPQRCRDLEQENERLRAENGILRARPPSKAVSPWMAEVARLQAQLSTARDEALEEAARECEAFAGRDGNDDESSGARHCADRIRALKSKP